MPLVITVAFNFNLLADSAFADNFKAHFYLKQIISEPTHVKKKSSTFIDHIYVSKDVSDYNKGTFNLHLSDHLATYIHRNNFCSVNHQKQHNIAKIYRSFKHLKPDELLTDLYHVPWRTINTFDTVDNALHFF